MAEHSELGDVAAEEERDRPVDHDAELSREERELVEVVAAGDEPAREAGEPQAEHVGDALVAAECRHLPEHPIAVGLWLACEVLGQAASLAQGVLRRRRIRLGAGTVRYARAVAE